MGKLKNKVILVTGASRGIGKGCVNKLLSEEASVIATDRDEALLEESHREWVVKFGKRIRIQFLDIASETDWIEVMSDIEANEGLLHGLVNNAGIVNLKPLEEMSLEEFKETQDVNLTGTFIGTKLAVDIMRRKNNAKGSIVNISSISGQTGTLNCGAYSASKGGVRMLSKAIALEVGAKREFIRINSVHPGVIMTPMQTERAGNDEELWEGIRKSIPLGRLGKPEDVANAVTYLLSDLSDFMTGAELTVDGGMRIALSGGQYND
ncbi:MAG: hypothetical protein CMD42_04930 [Gammaproteobacteria bacterium]|nr:hypothetical protein [Gammaproteobacteria bacterium]|tara:strand:- start:3332 stop:4126 length:795 start_codon:yes stop_codon:yes gene_type:complete